MKKRKFSRIRFVPFLRFAENKEKNGSMNCHNIKNIVKLIHNFM